MRSCIIVPYLPLAVQALVTVELLHHRLPVGHLPPQSLRATASGTPVPETDDASFWFANFDVGSGRNLSLLIDTGSSDVLINPGSYKPSSSAKKLSKTFEIDFATVNSDGSGDAVVYGDQWTDSVSLAGITATSQTLGNVTHSTPANVLPHNGLVGFAGSDESALRTTPFFHTVCNQRQVSECRFGLAYGTNGKGVQTLGGVDPTYAKKLSYENTEDEWQTKFDVSANGKQILTREDVIWDSGTTIIYGPIDGVRKLYHTLNIPTTSATVGGTQYLYGNYPCDSPPTVGFVLGGKTFNILPAVWPAKKNGTTCTGVVQGSDEFGDQWLVGQAFFQGRYIDHDITGKRMGFANLV